MKKGRIGYVAVAALCLGLTVLSACGKDAQKPPKQNDKTSESQVEIASEGLSYELSASGEYYILTGIGTCKDVDVIVPSAYNGAPVKEIGVSAFEQCQQLTSITLGANVTKIGGMAFFRCNALTSVQMNASLQRLEDGAFWGCKALKELSLPSSLTFIGAQAFFQCGVTSVVFGSCDGWTAGNVAVDRSALNDPKTAAEYLSDNFLGVEWKRG